MEKVTENICQKWYVDLIEFGGEADHIHILFAAYPNIDLSKFINNLKTVSSRMIQKSYPEHFAKFLLKARPLDPDILLIVFLQAHR